jgi:hypothetical protein
LLRLEIALAGLSASNFQPRKSKLQFSQNRGREASECNRTVKNGGRASRIEGRVKSGYAGEEAMLLARNEKLKRSCSE